MKTVSRPHPKTNTIDKKNYQQLTNCEKFETIHNQVYCPQLDI